MALFTPGPIVGQISGAEGGVVFSSNRYGPYIRRRAIPVNPQTPKQLKIRALTDKEAWRSWAANSPITNVLGLKQILDGHAAFVQCNNALKFMGLPGITLPPVGPAPDPLTSMTSTYDIGAGSCSMTWTVTPLLANTCLIGWGCVTDSAGVRNVNNMYRLFTGSSGAAVSPLDWQGDFEATIGTLQVGQYVHLRFTVMGMLTGLRSVPRTCTGVVVTS